VDDRIAYLEASLLENPSSLKRIRINKAHAAPQGFKAGYLNFLEYKRQKVEVEIELH
jgi:hypothetical protein